MTRACFDSIAGLGGGAVRTWSVALETGRCGFRAVQCVCDICSCILGCREEGSGCRGCVESAEFECWIPFLLRLGGRLWVSELKLVVLSLR
jgi:hypothetical protein